MKRKDAVEVFDINVYNRIYPYVMRKRTESLVFQTMTFDVTKLVEFVRDYNASHAQENGYRMKFFYAFTAAVMRTIAQRPKLNRFISNGRYWHRNELSLDFLIKGDYSDDGAEYNAILQFDESTRLKDIADKMENAINAARAESSAEDNHTDNVLEWVFRLPPWMIKGVISIIGFFDRKRGINWLRPVDGLHTSIFISSLGSVGLVQGSPMHHLYEWGTTSLFLTMGALNRVNEVQEDGSVVKKYNIICGATVDERICDGYYFIKSFEYLQEILNSPELLLTDPAEEPERTLSRKEWRQKLRNGKKEARQRKAAKKKVKE